MNTPDLLCVWPKNCDYPLWRKFIHEERARFNNVIVVFTETNWGNDYCYFLSREMYKDDVTSILSATVKSFGHWCEDWRNVAVNTGLDFFDAQWLWFTEMDFIPQEGFWKFVHSRPESVIAAYYANRMHPCCIFAKWDAIKKTSGNFSAIPDKADHFAIFQQDIEALGIPACKIPEKYYEHLNGFTHNFRLVADGGWPNYQERRFRRHIQEGLECGIRLDERYEEICRDYLVRSSDI